MPAHGRYRVVRKIADGGMAEIFLATQHGAEGFQRPVVLKRILAALLADPKFRNMLIDEAHVAMGLNHSNIVQVLDLGQSRGRYFLVLELVDGWDLHTILNRVKAADVAVPPNVGLYAIGEVCRALAYAHGRQRDGKALGIVHRDVSPHNVLVSEQGEVKLTDFGIAKALGRRERTGQGVIKGKLAFMSPEQASGSVLDARSDLFAVGTMLYLVFTGRRPFDAPTDLETILRVQQVKFSPPRAVEPTVPPEVESIILKAMKLAPSERYQSAEEMLIDIETVQRTVFQPAGQTELKRWLADLQKRDGLPPISRATLPHDDEVEVVDDLVEGVDIVFDDVEPAVLAPKTPPAPPTSPVVKAPPLPPPGGSGPARPPLSAPPEPPFAFASGPALPAVPEQRTEVADTRPPLEPPAETPPAANKRVRPMVLLVGAATALGVVLVSRKTKHAPPPEPEPEPTPKEPARTVEPTAAAPSPPPPETPAPKPADAGPDASPARDDAAPNDEDDEDEETLLKRRVPDINTTVIGDDDDAPAAPAVPAAPAAPPRPTEPTSAKRPPVAAAKPAEIVSVHVSSQPPGAVIKIKQRVFGRAPMNLRFRSDITYELTFVKRGFTTTVKRFTITKRKNQRISVTLKKKASGKKNLFQRLFGR